MNTKLTAGMFKGEIVYHLDCECGEKYARTEPFILTSMPPLQQLTCIGCGKTTYITYNQNGAETHTENIDKENFEHWKKDIEKYVPMEYRAWSKYRDQMYYGLDSVLTKKPDTHWIYMPFIGRFDSENQQIFVGDIISFFDEDSDMVVYGIVTFRSSSYIISNTIMNYYRWDYYKNITVLGNIFENTDLIEKHQI